MLLFLYEFLLTLFLPFFYLVRYLRRKKKDLHLQDRLGLSYLRSDTRKVCIWIHAVSLGEMKAIEPLYHKLKKKMDAYFVITTSTKTGLDQAKLALQGAHQYHLLPFDLRFILRRVMRDVQPHLLILCEGDLWPNFLQEAKRCGAKVALVNGKVSARSFWRMQKFPFFCRWIFPYIDLIFAQSQEHYDSFAQLKIPSKLSLSTNIKLAATPSREKPLTRKELGLTMRNKVIVMGSTHEGEEELFLSSFQLQPGQILFLVPRHPERFTTVADLLTKLKLPFVRISALPKKWTKQASITLVDQMGLLDRLYALADLSIVGGSFVDHIGGHNILEPLFAGSPVLFGPHMESQKALVKLVLEAQAGVQYEKGSLKDKITTLLNSPKELKEMVFHGQKMLTGFQGEIDRMVKRIDLLRRS